ncbi:demethylmenaquinone methyltransferase [Edaphobacillus lindanitolerans]|uniref:Demethylmenaquinone methyltransferase n=1 Tax=Edaphobacillus lindanitolerans TaxID=550447 RepID=A0A1U7PIP8_9BACI|nr:demethylmenaquinone methyltransferase [Edaphobacillus lindanitolerans]SIT66468.1 demethylmenaquinone methyltransferase / 2-methoxy-6-polyprenyl-1,4-benzoquinol methylase [Edaphobacillus lindanitolerans]
MDTQKEQRVHEVFQNISGNYDKMNSVISFQQHKAWRREMMNKMAVRPGADALDVCCGTGDWTLSLADAVGPDGTVTGLDFSANMLSVAEEKTADRKQIRLVEGNAIDLPFKDGTFDYVTVGFGLRNVPDLRKSLSEMYRVLKPGGMIACLETSQPKLPGYRQLFKFYFRFIMPVFGRLFAKKFKEYQWLQESADTFPDMEQLARIFSEAGFTRVSYKPFSGGAAAGHIGYKRKQ